MSENVNVTASLPKKTFSFGFNPKKALALAVIGAAVVIVGKAAKDKLDQEQADATVEA